MNEKQVLVAVAAVGIFIALVGVLTGTGVMALSTANPPYPEWHRDFGRGEIPAIPHTFEGAVRIGSSPAPDGTWVYAVVPTTNDDGQYIGPKTRTLKQCQDGKISLPVPREGMDELDSGKKVILYIDGEKARTYTRGLKAGGITHNFDLVVDAPTVSAIQPWGFKSDYDMKNNPEKAKRGVAYTLKARAVPDDEPVESVKVEVGDVLTKNMSKASDNTWIYTWSDPPSGQYWVTFTATDSGGDTHSTSATVKFTELVSGTDFVINGDRLSNTKTIYVGSRTLNLSMEVDTTFQVENPQIKIYEGTEADPSKLLHTIEGMSGTYTVPSDGKYFIKGTVEVSGEFYNVASVSVPIGSPEKAPAGLFAGWPPYSMAMLVVGLALAFGAAVEAERR